MSNTKKGGSPFNMNIVMGLVYLGASILIVVVGLRGLGNTVQDISFIPKAFVDSKGFISVNLVIFAILLEFSMLVLLSVATMLQKEETSSAPVPTAHRPGVDIRQMRAELDKLKELAREEKDIIGEYLDEFEKISDKITKIQAKNVQALKNIREEVIR